MTTDDVYGPGERVAASVIAAVLRGETPDVPPELREVAEQCAALGLAARFAKRVCDSIIHDNGDWDYVSLADLAYELGILFNQPGNDEYVTRYTPSAWPFVRIAQTGQDELIDEEEATDARD
jgi:hypothetical protein